VPETRGIDAETGKFEGCGSRNVRLGG
jgi:hypothetical protein